MKTTLAIIAASLSALASAQFDKDVLHTRYFNDAPNSNLTVTNNYPALVEFNETNLFNASGFANRHIWNVSPDGTNDTSFGTSDYWDVGFTLNLNGTGPSTLDKEAGFILQNSTAGSQGDSQFIVKSNGEVAMFGGSFTFHQFYKPNVAGDYQLGTDAFLELKYFNNGSSNQLTASVTYGGNTTSFTDATTIYPGTHIGGYAQYQITNTAGVENTGDAKFSNIKAVPEPSSYLAMLGLGAMVLVRRRKR